MVWYRSDVAIRTDAEGRYCLNDLQKAATSGANPRTSEVYEFIRRPETSDLISEIETTGDSRSCNPTDSKAGRYGGTYVCRGAQEIR